MKDPGLPSSAGSSGHHGDVEGACEDGTRKNISIYTNIVIIITIIHNVK